MKKYIIPEQYLTFQKFNDEGLANELAGLLRENNFDYILDDTSGFDPTFSNSELNKEFRIMLHQEDFEKADSLLLMVSASQLDKIQKDYYLFDFTDEELVEIVSKPDEWNQLDYLLAQKLLKDRGKEIEPEFAEELKKKRLIELAKPEKSQKGLIYFGYAVAIIGGPIAIIIGWHILTFKKTLPNGDRVYGYSIGDRKHGIRIVIIGIISLVLWTVWYVFSSSNS